MAQGEGGDIVSGFLNLVSSVFGVEEENEEHDHVHHLPHNDHQHHADDGRRQTAPTTSVLVPMATGDVPTEPPPAQRRKSSGFFGFTSEIRRKSTSFLSGHKYTPAPTSPRGSTGTSPRTTPRGSFSLFGQVEQQLTPEQKAAQEAKEAKHKEQAAFLEGRLYEFMELKDESSIINLDEAKKIAANLPPSQQMANWVLVYSTYRDGISMSTMFRKCYERGGAYVIIVKDEEKWVFGGFTTDPPHLTEEKHVGTGECFLFKLRPDFHVYKWTQANRYFMMGEEKAFHMGSGEGRFGLWVDSTLTHGHSAPCDTYGNEVLSSTTDFKVLGIEVWGFES